MLTEEPPQHLKHSCNQKEYATYVTGEKTFDIKLNDGVFNLQKGDIITLEERDDNGELTGNKETKYVGVVLNTADIDNVTPEEVTQKGISIFSLLHQDYKSLAAIYRNNFSLSVAIDRHDDVEHIDEINWYIVGEPSFAPVLSCPDFVKGGVLNSLGLEKWPQGRYSITLLLEIDLDKEDPPYEVHIVDIMVMTMIEDPEDAQGYIFANVRPDILPTGVVLHMMTQKEIIPLTVDQLHHVLSESMTTEELADDENLISDEQMQQMLDEARERGEDEDNLNELERAFLTKENNYDE